MYLKLTRTYQDDYQTQGELQVVENSSILYKCKTLELPWRDNQRRVSRIPNGIYPVIKHISPNFGKSLWIQDVPDRSEILIHVGNYNRDTLGCILVGKEFIDIDGDGHKDVTNSRKTINELYDIVVDELAIEIIQKWKI